ncbi:YdcF family protein [Methylomonas sp. EFPC1]|uniref:YdcF family protein n=1 Tax=Methylomonas sp. EFPC1 TaxID=2812647 RepID=UPI001966ED19|nr:YdcF family protein [Methylomonas sp. EFPC1]QSB02066.1 YdcF family protein [Methylomonas sp. EFPC1]
MQINKIKSPEKSEIIMVLGSTINSEGKLSEIAVGRLEKCIEVVKNKDDYLIVLTGGFGSHFNTTNRMYSLYAYEYLINNGIDTDRISALIPSVDTVEDATLSYRVIKHLNPLKVVIITSEFHQERVKYIFGKVYKDFKLEYVSSAYMADNETMRQLALTEERELKQLKETNRSSIGSSLD